MATLERRALLGATAAVAIGSSMAGCLDDDDDEEQPDSDLGIEHVRFLSEEPAGYRDYTEVEDDSYEPGELVWIYFEPVGLSTTDAGDGAAEIDFRMELEVTDPAGEQFDFDDDVTREIPDGAVDEQYLYWSFTPPSPITTGEYTAELSLVDEIADESVQQATTFTIGEELPVTPADELSIEHVRRVATEPTGYRDYQLVEDGIYDQGETVWLYYEPVGLTPEASDDDQVRVRVDTTLAVVDPEGRSESFHDSHDLTLTADEYDELYLSWEMTLEDLGVYDLTIEISDAIGDDDAENSTAVIVQPEDPRAAFQETIATELDVTIESVVVENGLVKLVYATPNPMGSSPASQQIGYIAGVFAGLIHLEWDVNGLEAMVTDEHGDEYVFSITRELAEAYLAGEITDDEYASEIIETLTEA